MLVLCYHVNYDRVQIIIKSYFISDGHKYSYGGYVILIIYLSSGGGTFFKW